MDASFDLMVVNDLSVILVDLDQGRSVTKYAPSVINDLQKLLPGGIGNRTVYYRDTMGRFDKLLVIEGEFAGFAPCSERQQDTLSLIITGDTV